MLEQNAFYGAVEGTICSIVLSILPTSSLEKASSLPTSDAPENYAAESKSNTTLLLQTLLKCLHEMGGFTYMEVFLC